jgi:CheY-like chemotaxis protein
MFDIKRFKEHNKINQYLKRRSIQLSKTRQVINHEDRLSNFPIGLIIITKDENEVDRIEHMNHYARQLFHLKQNSNIKELKDKFKEYIKLKHNYTSKTNITLKDVIFNSSPFNFEIENFFPFQCQHSKNIILYIKINDIENQKYIVIDKYDKYIEEQKYIEFNLIKNINYQYLHTLYHELNNPLNALMAISGEKINFDYTSDDAYNKSMMTNGRRTIKSYGRNKRGYKKEKKSSTLISLYYSKNRTSNDHKYEENNRSRKKSLGEYHHSLEIGNRINLLVKIIKIFIKNFILYLKTRADSLLSLKNEFDMQKEASDIINAVEVSEYEKELTKHKKMKLNLEYVFDLYFNKYQCLFKYKEIECETHFSELKNLFVVADDFNFSYLIRQIFTYLYYVIPKKEGFFFSYDKTENNKIKIIINKKINGNSSKITDKSGACCINQFIQTKEMTKEVLYYMSKKLKFRIEIFDNENNNNNINGTNIENNKYLSITIPIIQKDKITEDDEFKDDDIDENVSRNNIILEEKIKRQLPCIGLNNDQKYSNVSTIHIVDMLSKNGDDKKDSSDSFISFPKNLSSKINDINLNNRILSNNNLNLNINDFPKNKISINSTPSNDSFLSKCLMSSDAKKFVERDKKEKSRFNNYNQVNINLIQNKINRAGKNIYINITNINNNNPKMKDKKYTKTKSYVCIKRDGIKKNETIIKNQKTRQLKGIFTLINKYGYAEVMDNCDPFISDISNSSKKLKNREITFQSQSHKSSLKSKTKQKNITISKFNVEPICESAMKNSGKAPFKSSCFNSNTDDSNEKNNNINNIDYKNKNKNNIIVSNLLNNGVNIEYKKEEENLAANKNFLKSKKNLLLLSEIEEGEKKRKYSNNLLVHNKSNKDCMTFYKKKLNSSKDNSNTLVDDNVKDNNCLFIEANKERNAHLLKLIPKTNINFNNSQSNIEQKSEVFDEDEEFEENGENEDEEDLEENENDSGDSKEQCNCADLLVVDDEEFNVMASQRMLKNMGFNSDKAFNGQECINLIKEKKESNCKCNKKYYQIIFLDIVMPVMGGIKAAKKIQEMIDNKEINDNTKIVFISGNIDDSQLRDSLLKINCVKECLPKPVQISKYQKIIEKYYKIG